MNGGATTSPMFRVEQPRLNPAQIYLNYIKEISVIKSSYQLESNFLDSNDYKIL